MKTFILAGHHHRHKDGQMVVERQLRILVEETNNLARNVLPASLLVIHDTSRCGQHNVSKLTRWQQLHNPFLEFTQTNVVPGGDDTSLVQTRHGQ